MKRLAIWAIKFYRSGISPLTPPSCRFYPTCSQYGLESIERFGFFKGFYLLIRRIIKCQPFHPGGFDPVPETFKWQPENKSVDNG